MSSSSSQNDFMVVSDFHAFLAKNIILWHKKDVVVNLIQLQIVTG